MIPVFSRRRAPASRSRRTPGLRDRPGQELHDRRRRGHLRARQGVRERHEHAGQVRPHRLPRRLPRQPAVAGWQKCEKAALNTNDQRRRERADATGTRRRCSRHRRRHPRASTPTSRGQLRVRARHVAGRVRGLQGREQAAEHRVLTLPHGRPAWSASSRSSRTRSFKMYYCTVGQLADPGRPDGRHDEARRGEDPAARSCSRSSCRAGEAGHRASRAIRGRRRRRRSSR